MAASIPVIDLRAFHGSNSSEALQKLADCLRDYGLFQIENHGVDPEMRSYCPHEYFQLPENTGMFTSFNVKKDEAENQRDFLKLHCHPIEEFIQQWPTHPSCLREYVAEYCRNVKELGLKLHGAISESLGLHHTQQLAMDYYSNCPQPELIWELLGDADKVILVQLKDEVPSLQLLEVGKWVASNPIANTFTFTVGDRDQMQVLIAHDFKLPFMQAYGPRWSSLPAFIGGTQSAVGSHAPPSPLIKQPMIWPIL